MREKRKKNFFVINVASLLLRVHSGQMAIEQRFVRLFTVLFDSLCVFTDRSIVLATRAPRRLMGRLRRTKWIGMLYVTHGASLEESRMDPFLRFYLSSAAVCCPDDSSRLACALTFPLFV